MNTKLGTLITSVCAKTAEMVRSWVEAKLDNEVYPELEKVLPEVTDADDGKILSVIGGAWNAEPLPRNGLVTLWHYGSGNPVAPVGTMIQLSDSLLNYKMVVVMMDDAFGYGTTYKILQVDGLSNTEAVNIRGVTHFNYSDSPAANAVDFRFYKLRFAFGNLISGTNVDFTKMKLYEETCIGWTGAYNKAATVNTSSTDIRIMAVFGYNPI